MPWWWTRLLVWALENWDASATAFAHAAETSPSPRILTQWALAESNRGKEEEGE